MHYRLTTELEQFIRDCTDSGDYGDASEVVRDALGILKLRREHETQKLKRLREAVKEGRDAADRGDYVELNDDKDLEEFFARL